MTGAPLTLADRHPGRGEAPAREGLRFLGHRLSLRFGRLSRFAAVGASGVVVNLAAMGALLGLGVHYVAASVLATELAIASNFLLGERFVFRDRLGSRSWARRAWSSLLLNNIEVLARIPLIVVMVQGLGTHELQAQAATIAAAFLLRYLVLSRVVYGDPPARTAPAVPAARRPGPGPATGR